MGSPGLGIELAGAATSGVPGESDAILMTRVKRGDRAAFGDLVDRHQNTVVSYLTRLTRDRAHAEDLAQEAFLRLYQKSSYYREQGQLLPYVLRIATNLLRTEQRRAKRWRNLTPALTHHRAVSPPTPQRSALGNEASEAVERALDALPLRFRAPIVLREIEGLSYKEIAGALGCREGTVKSRISRGRAQLKELLEPYWHGVEA